MSCEATSILKRFYHHGAIMRDERLRSQFVDILYDLNDVTFLLENKVGCRTAAAASTSTLILQIPP